MTDVDVAVVGAGLVGAATAWAVSRRGASVALIEARTLGHREGSSHGSARIFRRAYSDPLYIGLTGRAGELWDELADAAGEKVLRRTGGLDFGRGREPETLAELMRASGVPVELLAPEAAAERWPGFAFDPAEGPVLFHAEAGVLDADRAIAAMVRSAVEGGAVWHQDTPVLRLEPVANGVRLHLPGGSILAGTVVTAAGPWLAPLVGDLAELPPLRVVEQQAIHFPRRDPAVEWPIFIHQDATEVYGLPGGRDGGPGEAIKLGQQEGGRVTTAADRTFVVDPTVRRQLSDYVAARLPGLDPEQYSEISCLYTKTPTEDFVVDRVGSVVVCSACSGHGAKLATAVGELVADVATGGPSAPERFTLAAHRRAGLVAGTASGSPIPPPARTTRTNRHLRADGRPPATRIR